jgi:protocatechuate 3,4-dioxygenase beta subunit
MDAKDKPEASSALSPAIPRREALKGLGVLAVSGGALAAIGCSTGETPPPPDGMASTPPSAAGTGSPAAAGTSQPAATTAGAQATATAGRAAPAASGGSPATSGPAGAPATSAPAAGSGSGGSSASAAGGSGVAGAAAGSSTTLDMLSCIATPAMEEGPFFIDEKLQRADLIMGETSEAVTKGTPLRLVMGIYKVSGSMCMPLSGIQVDIWHADAVGVYSDVASGFIQSVDTRGQKFLRGYLITDERGLVEFKTIYPGWYMSRTIHIHFKLRMPAGSNSSYDFTSQMYFDEMTNDKVLGQGVYASRSGTRSIKNANDHIFNGQPTGNMMPPANGMAPGEKIMPTLVAVGDGYDATLKIGLMI